MDPDIKSLLEKNLALSEENHRILRGLRRSNRLGLIWRVIYIGIFLGGAAIAFNFLKPYYEGVRGTYDSFRSTQTQINEGVGGFKAFFTGEKREEEVQQ